MRSISALALFLGVPWLTACAAGSVGGGLFGESEDDGASESAERPDIEQGAPPMMGDLAMPDDPTAEHPSGGSGGERPGTSGEGGATSGAGGSTPACGVGDERSSATTCGLNHRGYILEVCDAGEWRPSVCSDPDVCYDGSFHPGVTPCGERGVVSMTCMAGRWVDLPGCLEPPVCSCPEEGDCESDACHPKAMCRMVIADYVCQCGSGYEGNGESCVDVDECAKAPCGTNETCHNEEGSYSCRCAPGYEAGPTGCADIDECQHDPCDPEASCDNMDGYVICTCPPGFSGDGYVCTPI